MVLFAQWVIFAFVAFRKIHSARNDEGDEDLDEAEFFGYLIASIVLVLMAGLMSGLTLGLMSLDDVDLEVLKRSGNSRQRACAQRILPVISNPHRLLVTLLVCNAAAAEALPLVLDRLADPITAVIISVTVVLFFGEIIPQAACSAYGLEIGAISAPFVRVLVFLISPVNIPIGYILDKVLGHRHTALFRRGELKALVDIHGEGQSFGGHLTADEVRIIKGALDMTHKTARTAMTPLDLVFMLPLDATLDEKTMTAILASGHSRVPIHRPGNRSAILGIVLVKELILVDTSAGLRISEMKIRSLPHLLAETPMYDMLKLFELGRSHMAVLTEPTVEALETRQSAEDALAIDIYSIEDELSDDRDVSDEEYNDGNENENDEEQQQGRKRPNRHVTLSRHKSSKHGQNSSSTDNLAAVAGTSSSNTTKTLPIYYNNNNNNNNNSRQQDSSDESDDAPPQGSMPSLWDLRRRQLNRASTSYTQAMKTSQSSSSFSDSDYTDDGDEDDRPRIDVFALDFQPHELVAVGIITIEDVLEELLGSEIVDETDMYVDNLHVTRVNAAALMRSLPPHLRKAVNTWNLTPRIGPAMQVYKMSTQMQDRDGEGGGSALGGGSFNSIGYRSDGGGGGVIGGGNTTTATGQGGKATDEASGSGSGVNTTTTTTTTTTATGQQRQVPRVWRPSNHVMLSQQRSHPNLFMNNNNNNNTGGNNSTASNTAAMMSSIGSGDIGGRRKTNFTQGVQNQLDLLEPLLAAQRERQTSNDATDTLS